MNESLLLRQIQLAAADRGVRLFRNNVGVGWVGDAFVNRAGSGPVQLRPGDVVVRRARPLHAGLCEGSSDLIGWRTVTITPEMVGRRVAVLVAVEGKSERVTVTKEQAQFLGAVHMAGGIAVVARSVDDVIAAIEDQT